MIAGPVPSHRRLGPRFLIGLGAVVLLAALFLAGGFYVESQPPQPGQSHPVQVHVAMGDTVDRVGQVLARQGVIRSQLLFDLWGRYTKLSAHLRAGTYVMARGWSLGRVMSSLNHGDILVYRVTIPEGFTVRQIVERLVHDHVARKTALEAAIRAGIPQLAAPAGVRNPVEGFLFPDTYDIPAGTPARQVLLIMWNNFLKRTRRLRPQLAAHGLTLWQWVTMASIVQAEVQYPADAPKIAAVFYNRLKIGMKIQSDATVRYALGTSVKGALTYHDLAVASPYNTYTRPGLPVGPIDCPGLIALKAALKPALVPYLYFVSTPTGQDLFASTYAQHQANVSKVEAMAVPTGR